MWAGPAQRLGRAQELLVGQHILFLGQAGPKWFGPGPHGCWPDPATMLINHVACRTNSYSACSNLVSSNGEAVLPDAGVPKWRPGWSRRGGDAVRIVAEAVAKMAAGGRAI